MGTRRRTPLLNKDNVGDHDKGDERTAAESFKDSSWAWLACSLCVIDQIFIAGLINAFGVFFVEFIKEFKSTKSETAWLGSLCYGVMKLFAPLTSIVVKQFSNRIAIMIGLFICSISIFSSSYVTDIRILYATFPLVYGIGSSLIVNPAMMLPNTYFDRHYGLATGLVCAGSSVGTIVLSLTSQNLVSVVGWRMTFRVFSGVLLLLAVSNVLIMPVPKTEQLLPLESISKPVLKTLIEDLKLWKNRVFILWSTATSLVMFGYFVPNVHLIQFALDNGIPGDKAALILVLSGFSTTVGRLLSGRILEVGVVNRLHLDQLLMVISGTSFMILPYLTTFAGIATYVLIVGLFDGCFIVLLPLLTYSLVGAENATMAWGYMCLTSSVTFALGPPTVGFLYDINGNYNIAFHCSGIPVILGATILFFIPWAERTSQTNNAMVVLSDLECGDDANLVEHSSSFSPRSHTDRRRPEVIGLPFMIHPHFSDNQSRRFRPHRTTDREVTASGLQTGSLPTHGAFYDLDNAKTSRSEVGPGKYIINSRQKDEFPEGYLDQLRSQVTALIYESSLSIQDPSSPGAMQMGETPKLRTSFTSTASSALEQLVQEHIELFLVDLASRKIPISSVSSLSNRLAAMSSLVSTADQTVEGHQLASPISSCNQPERHHTHRRGIDDSSRSEHHHMSGEDFQGNSKHHTYEHFSDKTERRHLHDRSEQQQQQHHLLHGQHLRQQGLDIAGRSVNYTHNVAGGPSLALSSVSCNSVRLTRTSPGRGLWSDGHTSSDSDREESPRTALCSISVNSGGWEADGQSETTMEKKRSPASVITEESGEMDMFQHLFTDDNS